MRIVGISGSPRIDGNTDLILNEALKAAESSGAETKLIRLCDYKLQPCNACMTCFSSGKCVIEDDWQVLYDELTGADGIILGSPSYFQGATAQMKIFIARIGFLALAREGGFHWQSWRRNCSRSKVRCSSTCNQMMTFLTAVGVAIPSGGRVFAIGREKGEVLNDKEGMETAPHLGLSILRV
jgi:multimeric flavodoxin WrbA